MKNIATGTIVHLERTQAEKERVLGTAELIVLLDQTGMTHVFVEMDGAIRVFIILMFVALLMRKEVIKGFQKRLGIR